MQLTQRKAAKSAKSLCVYIKEFLCVLCVFAVKAVFNESLPAHPVGYGANTPQPTCIDDAIVQINNITFTYFCYIYI
jgi:hypothetical protein